MEKSPKKRHGFTREDKQILPGYRNMPLYVIVFIHTVELRTCIDRSKIFIGHYASTNTRGDGDLLMSNCWAVDRCLWLWR